MTEDKPVIGDKIRASETWPACTVWPLLGCLCRGGNPGGCIRKRERDQGRRRQEEDR